MRSLIASLILLTLGAHTFAAQATTDVKDKAGNVQWTLALAKDGGGKDVITVYVPGDRNKSVLRVRIQSEKNAIITALSRLEEMARNAKFQRLTAPMKKEVESTQRGLLDSFAFRINDQGEHQMLVNGRAYTPEQITALKDLVNRLDSYAAELRKATSI